MIGIIGIGQLRGTLIVRFTALCKALSDEEKAPFEELARIDKVVAILLATESRRQPQKWTTHRIGSLVLCV